MEDLKYSLFLVLSDAEAVAVKRQPMNHQPVKPKNWSAIRARQSTTSA
jgi:predicted RNA polymerase sigma factor